MSVLSDSMKSENLWNKSLIKLYTRFVWTAFESRDILALWSLYTENSKYILRVGTHFTPLCTLFWGDVRQDKKDFPRIKYSYLTFL